MYENDAARVQHEIALWMEDWVKLENISEISPANAWRLLNLCATAKEIFKDVLDCDWNQGGII